ncbi:MAG: metallophosphoesterase family protein [Thermoanaerobaculia bacterium]|nr:metallophosphoesterase family protein [Thermoanaerobaculia bacterium]
MEVLFLVDLHWTEKRALELPPLDDIDLVLLGGDLTNFRGAETARTIVEAIRAAGPRVLSVCGNCDRPEMEAYLRDEDIDLDRRRREVSGVDIVGISAGLPFGDLPYERSEDEFRAAARDAFAGTGERPTVLVSHQPPRGTRCDLVGGRHVGSQAVREAVLEHGPDLVLCGHLHEAVATDRLGTAVVVNPGPWFAGNSFRFRIAEGRVDLEPAAAG